MYTSCYFCVRKGEMIHIGICLLVLPENLPAPNGYHLANITRKKPTHTPPQKEAKVVAMMEGTKKLLIVITCGEIKKNNVERMSLKVIFLNVCHFLSFWIFKPCK